MKKANLPNYKAVILAGGEGTRLYPVTKEIPKPLLLVRKKPIINYLVDLFYFYGIKEIAVLINSDFREDFDWWKKRYYGSTRASTELSRMSSGQVPKIKIIEEKKPLGTFGGLWHLKDWISEKPSRGEPAEPFFFTNGDELKKVDLIEMNKFHQKMGAPATIALVKVPDPHHYGVVLCKRGLVQEFLEKPSPAQISKKIGAGKKSIPRYINSGLYLFSPEIFDYHPGLKFSMNETYLFPKLAKEKKLASFRFNGKWMDCGTWQRYEEALKKWK